MFDDLDFALGPRDSALQDNTSWTLADRLASLPVPLGAGEQPVCSHCGMEATEYTFGSFVPGEALHNAKVAVALLRWEILVDEPSSGLLVFTTWGVDLGVMTFDEVVEEVTAIDAQRLLSPADHRSAVAMIFHLAPALSYDDEIY